LTAEYHLTGFSQAITGVRTTQWAVLQEKFTNGCLNKKHFGKTSIWKAVNCADSKLIDDVFARTGAYIMGKRMFEEGEVHWKEDLYKADVYVLTHEKREP
jgi:dihydrofolate reductase